MSWSLPYCLSSILSWIHLNQSWGFYLHSYNLRVDNSMTFTDHIWNKEILERNVCLYKLSTYIVQSAQEPYVISNVANVTKSLKSKHLSIHIKNKNMLKSYSESGKKVTWPVHKPAIPVHKGKNVGPSRFFFTSLFSSSSYHFFSEFLPEMVWGTGTLHCHPSGYRPLQCGKIWSIISAMEFSYKQPYCWSTYSKSTTNCLGDGYLAS